MLRSTPELVVGGGVAVALAVRLPSSIASADGFGGVRCWPVCVEVGASSASFHSA